MRPPLPPSPHAHHVPPPLSTPCGTWVVVLVVKEVQEVILSNTGQQVSHKDLVIKRHDTGAAITRWGGLDRIRGGEGVVNKAWRFDRGQQGIEGGKGV
eukprot:sb/3478916/